MPNIALILSGAVSLGSWEAGVLDELLYQLDRLNGSLSPEERFKIDVITGASAGAMTAGLVARAVMVSLDERRFLRQAWVDEIDIARLLQGIPENALLSKEPVAEIAGQYLSPPGQVAPSSIAPPRLLMRFAVSNMSGVDYELQQNARPGSGARRLMTTFHAESREFSLDDSNISDGETWERIREAAISSGNFPFAFAPHRLASDEEPWRGHALDPFPPTFTYVDGGMFNNEPLGEAVRLARELDGTPENPGLDPKRIFLLVDANLNASKHDPHFSDDASLPDTVLRTLAVLLSESSALDWLKARRFNNEIGWRDAFLELLAGMVKDTTVDDPAAFSTSLEQMADRIVDDKRALFPDRYPLDYREKAVERTLRKYDRLTEGMDSDRREIFGTLAFLLNSVSGLDKKDQLNLHVIYTTPTETAGDRMRAFAGFFNHEWRTHDYQVGRRNANQDLPWILEGKEDPYDREPGVGYDPPDLGDVDLESTPRGPREQLRDATLQKVTYLSRNLGVGPRWIRWATGPLTRWGLKKVVKKKLNDALKL